MIHNFKIPPITKIYLDMDGVIVSDTDTFKPVLSGVKNVRDYLDILKIFGKKSELFTDIIFKAIERNLFLKAEPTLFLTALHTVLLPYWKELGIEVEILSSSMKVNPLRKEIIDQKLQWLKNHHLDHLPINLVEGSEIKQEYAKVGHLLIDDYDRTIGQFISKGGYGIQYTSLNEVMHKLRLIGLSPQQINY